MIRNLFFSLSVLSAPFALAAQSAGSLSFPDSWAGRWAGTLEIFNAARPAQSLPMELHILPLDSAGRYSWTIIYGEDKEAGRRSYELAPIDPEKGFYAIDEKNSIVLESYLLGGKLFSSFEVMGNHILSSYEKRGEELLFEIISGRMDPVSVTGGQEGDESGIPPVKAFPVIVTQRAALKRVE